MINWDQNRSRFRDKMAKYDEKLYEAVEHYGRYYRIYEMFESHTGWLWFTLEMFSNQPDLCYGLVCGFWYISKVFLYVINSFINILFIEDI